MNHWWRLYAHLAPLLPRSPVLQRVEANARADAPEPTWKHIDLPIGQPFKTMKAMYDVSDEDCLRELSEDLEYYMGLYANKNKWTFQKAFAACYARSGRLTREQYIEVFRFYRKPKLQRGPRRDLSAP